MSQKYTDARYPEKINDFIDNQGEVSEEGKEALEKAIDKNLEVLAFIEGIDFWGATFIHLRKREDGVWYLNPQDCQDSKFPKTQTAMIIYSYKRNKNSPIQGGCVMLFNDNTMELCNFPDTEEYFRVITTTDENNIVTLTVDQQNMSYARVLVVNMPIQVDVDLEF